MPTKTGALGSLFLSLLFSLFPGSPQETFTHLPMPISYFNITVTNTSQKQLIKAKILCPVLLEALCPS